MVALTITQYGGTSSGTMTENTTSEPTEFETQFNSDIVDQVAKTIFLFEGGVPPEEFPEKHGKQKALWDNSDDWDYESERILTDEQRKEYRYQAIQVLTKVKDYLIEQFNE